MHSWSIKPKEDKSQRVALTYKLFGYSIINKSRALPKENRSDGSIHKFAAS